MNKLAIFILGLGILAPLPALGEGVQSTPSTTSTPSTSTPSITPLITENSIAENSIAENSMAQVTAISQLRESSRSGHGVEFCYARGWFADW